MKTVAALVLGFVCGILSYGIVGIAIARVTGVGQFYSVPVGWMKVNDETVFLSVLAWGVVYSIAIHAALKRLSAAKRR